MKTWCHLPTISRRMRILQYIAVSLLLVVFFTTQIFAHVSTAAPSTNRTINFQGRLLTNTGAVVADGYYNMQFKIYEGGAGTAVNNPGGTLKWTETYLNNNQPTGAVQVKNGLFSIKLGGNVPFGDSIDWSAENLWLSMNVAGNATNCTTFGTAPCAADGEMLPMKAISATAYALSAGSLEGKTASNFVQLGQGAQTDSTPNASSIFINKLSTGNLVQLQHGGTDLFTVTDTGNLTLGGNDDKSISVATADEGLDGRQLSLVAGSGGSGSGSAGGNLTLQGGAGGGENGQGGSISIDAGAGTGTAMGGTISLGTTNASSITIGSTSVATSQTINIGTSNIAGGSTDVTIGSGGASDSGSTNIQAKDDVTISTNGETRVTFSGDLNTAYFGNGVTSSAPNDFTLQGTGSASDGASGGSLTLRGGIATVGNAHGGNITLSGGSGSGSGASGLVVIDTPTFSTITDDAQCRTHGENIATSCTITSASVDNAAAIMVGFSAAGQRATLPDPTITTAGRLMYIIAAADSEDFVLQLNGSTDIALKANGAVSLMWNGSDWITTSTTNTSSLLSVNTATAAQTPNVQIGDGSTGSALTLLTVDRAASAPPAGDSNALLGSMYYDTTLGKLQCYEADGWGSCGASPDVFVTLSPEYANAVMHGTDEGEMSSGLCSDTLGINNGSSSQPTICGTKETHNFYQWTTPEVTDQTKSIFVTYQLPSTFKEFSPGSISLLGRTDSADASVTYQIYRNSTGGGLTQCGSDIAVSTGAQTAWQTGTAAGAQDPRTSCSFEPGDSIVFRINLSAKGNAKAFASNLNFTYSNQ